MKMVFKAVTAGLALMAVSFSASASQYSFTMIDASPGDTYVGSTLTGTIDFGNSITPTGSNTVYDDAGTWTFTVTSATGNSDITSLVGDVFYDNTYSGDSYITFTNGNPNPMDVTSFGMYTFTDSAGNYIYNYGDSPYIYFFPGGNVFYADLANNNYDYPTLTAVTDVPEPTSMALLAGGVAGLATLRRRRRRA